ncbi:MAG: DNA-binding response regulator [Bacteroides sp. 43_108]|nr:MAG: DNA-binding response regulator [Bacteroides sp. 43_108]
MKILVIEDEPSLREIIVRSLTAERYVVEEAKDYISAEDKLCVYDYDCILLDIMLPDGNGLKLLEQLKADGKQSGVIIISARDSLDDKVNGLELGADDYLPKPFHLSELHARIRSVLRRKNNSGSKTVDFGNVSISTDTFSVKIAGKPLELSRKEYDILLYFVNRRGHMIKKEQIAEAIWGDYIDQCDNYGFVYAQIKNLRKKIDDAGADIEIKTIYGFGYKMVEKE